MERTFAYIKPDAVAAGHVGHVLSRVEQEGFIVERMTTFRFTEAAASALYAEHVGKSFWPDLLAFTCSGPVVLLVLAREDTQENVVARWRNVLGATDPRKANELEKDPLPAGTRRSLRGLYGNKEGVVYRNVAHGSATAADAERELALAEAWFAGLGGGCPAKSEHMLDHDTMRALDAEVVRGRKKFSRNRFLLAALAEEVGELAEAQVSGSIEAVREEALQVAATALRVYEEGDATTYQLDGFVTLVASLGQVARGYLQRRLDHVGRALNAMRATTVRLMTPDPTFADVDDEAAQP